MDVKSGYFLSGDVTRSSPLLYREYCIRDAKFDACSVANIGVLGTRVNPDTCQSRVDVEIFESGKKKLRTQKYLDTCGRGLSFL